MCFRQCLHIHEHWHDDINDILILYHEHETSLNILKWSLNAKRILMGLLNPDLAGQGSHNKPRYGSCWLQTPRQSWKCFVCPFVCKYDINPKSDGLIITYRHPYDPYNHAFWGKSWEYHEHATVPKKRSPVNASVRSPSLLSSRLKAPPSSEFLRSTSCAPHLNLESHWVRGQIDGHIIMRYWFSTMFAVPILPWVMMMSATIFYEKYGPSSWRLGQTTVLGQNTHKESTS